ncbi:MAG: PRC-barrel domain-containing protein [Burkholderiales bacterium]|nr:PRC-barrel domain-containing protein [Burkholderiales bacterium]
MTAIDYKADSEAGGAGILPADTLEGDKVVNQQGEDLGRVEAIMLDTGRGRIAYAVLSFGGFLGMGEKLFAIPWGALKVDSANERVMLNVDKQQLENAPGFDKDNWPQMADRQWAASIHSHYRARPYWE